MGDVFSIILLVLTAAFIVTFLKEHSPSFAMVLSFATVGIILLLILPSISGMLTSLESVVSLVTQEPFEIIIKAVGISVITQITSELCIDSGQRALAAAINLCGKVAIILSALPMLNDLLDRIVHILN